MGKFIISLTVMYEQIDALKKSLGIAYFSYGMDVSSKLSFTSLNSYDCVVIFVFKDNQLGFSV